MGTSTASHAAAEKRAARESREAPLLLRVRARYPRHITWLPAPLLATAAGLGLFGPQPRAGMPFAYLACMTAAALAGIRHTAVVVALAIALVASVLLMSPGDFTALYLANAVVAGLLALEVCRFVTSQSARLTTVGAIVEELQRAILPAPRPFVGGLRIASRYEAAQSAARIGGDLYAVAETPFGLRAIIADVRGKGLTSVSTVSVVVGAFREHADYDPDLGTLAQSIDRALVRTPAADVRDEYTAEGFATALLIQYVPGAETVSVLSCGHPSPYLVFDGRVEAVGPGGDELPLGLLHLSPERGVPSDFAFPRGADLLCVTDGVTEARDAAGVLYDPLAGLLTPAGAGPTALVEALLRSVDRWTGGTRHDDLAVIALHRPLVSHVEETAPGFTRGA